eukprot:Nk52_evm22s1020 gene=Nk52_evmTU22s1020
MVATSDTGMTVGESTECDGIEELCLLAKPLRGEGLKSLIMKAAEDKNILGFGELLSMPNVQELKSTNNVGYYNLLMIFACGTYSDYAAQKSSLPIISDAAIFKLKQLTVAGMASVKKTIAYGELLSDLDLQDVRSLEDLLIDAIYNEILVGKLDQKNQCLEIEYAIGRDLPSGSLDSIIQLLMGWSTTCETMLSALGENIQLANTAKANDIERRGKLEAQVRNIQKELQKDRSSTELANGRGEFSSMEYFQENYAEDPRSRTRRNKGAKSSHTSRR